MVLFCGLTKGLIFSYWKSLQIFLLHWNVLCFEDVWLANAHSRKADQNPFLQTIPHLSVCVFLGVSSRGLNFQFKTFFGQCAYTHLGHLICTSGHFGFTFSWVHFGRIYFFLCPHLFVLFSVWQSGRFSLNHCTQAYSSDCFYFCNAI